MADFLIVPAVFINACGILYLVHPKRGRVGLAIMVLGFILEALATKLFSNIAPMPNFFLITIGASTTAVGLFFAIQPKFGGLQIIAPIGMLMNSLVRILNGGRMPVSRELIDWLNWYASTDQTHSILMVSNIRFFVLSDWIYAPFFGGMYIFSLGDALMYIGVIMSAVQVLRCHQLSRAHQAAPLDD